MCGFGAIVETSSNVRGTKIRSNAYLLFGNHHNVINFLSGYTLQPILMI